MNDTWTTHHKGTIGGRPVEVKTYSEGGYRVCTDQGADDDGGVIATEAGTAVMPPTSKGRPIDIDEETLDEVSKQLAWEGFSPSMSKKSWVTFRSRTRTKVEPKAARERAPAIVAA